MRPWIVHLSHEEMLCTGVFFSIFCSTEPSMHIFLRAFWGKICEISFCEIRLVQEISFKDY